MSENQHTSGGTGGGRGYILKAAAVMLVTGAMTWPALAVTLRTGTITAAVTVTFKVAPPAGSSVSCTVSAISSDARGPSDSRFVNVPVAGTKAVCNLSMPYRWLLDIATSKMAIYYSVSGPNQSSSGIYSTIAMPANGAVTKVSLAITH